MIDSPQDPRIRLEKQVHLFGQMRQVYGVEGYDGFHVIANALPRRTQLELVHQALAKYPEKPNRTNLDPFHPVEELTDIWTKERTSVAEAGVVKNSLLSKLRWATMGYQYDWTARTYPLDTFTPIPDDLSRLAAYIAEALGYTVRSEAAIVNYYMHDSQMGPHKDESELTYDHPVVSFSMGSTAVFLLGGDTRQEEPVACYLRSGDVSILGGASRLRLHGVARILMGDTPDYLKLDALGSVMINPNGLSLHDAFGDSDVTSEEEKQTEADTESTISRETEELLLRYLQGTRVNINVRQVFPSRSDDDSRQVEAQATVA